MDAADIETLYQSLMFGKDEPAALWATGATIKRLAQEIGKPDPKDDRGNPLEDEDLYCVTERGTFLVE